MAENSKIEWCDHTFNPWRGCTKVSPGCANCYAETLSKRNPTVLGEWGKGKPRVLASDAMWGEPLKWAKLAPYFVQCTNCGKRFDQRNPPDEHTCHYKWQIPAHPRVFCASLADWLDIEVPDFWLTRLLKLIGEAPNLDWLLLTKRPELWSIRMGDVIGSSGAHAEDELWPHEGAALAEDWVVRGNAPPNVWIGTSVEDQTRAAERIPQLLQIPAKVRFLSCEPLLGPVEFFDIETGWPFFDLSGNPSLHWVIAGGESGPHARPMNPDWARSLRDQCQAAGVPFLFKQWGEWAPANEHENNSLHSGYCHPKGRNAEWPSPPGLGEYGPTELEARGFRFVARIGKKAAGRLLDGRTWDQFPDSATPATRLASPHPQPHPQP
jgi:protein gp37